jgi:spore germination protein GerM
MKQKKVDLTPSNNNNNHHHHQKDFSFLAGISVAVVVVVGLSTWWGIHTITTSNKPSIPTMLVPDSEQTNNLEEKIAEIYWIKTTDKTLEFVPVPVTMEKSPQPEVNLEAALKRLLADVNSKDYSSAIPKGTNLIGVKLSGNEVFVNLSQQFTTGGGSASMIGRLGQIIYTATSLNPKAKVWLEIEGETLEVLGGEGVMLEQPLTRQYFEANMMNFVE